jgi:F-type H+-transporting ATPase subunit epsilon
MTDRIEVELVTPERLFLSTPALLVEVPGVEGDMGIMPMHAPIISQLRPGVVEIVQSETVRQQIFVSGGVVEVTNERCTILAKEAIVVSDIKIADIKERLSEAERHHSRATSEKAKIDAEADFLVAEAMAAALDKK